MGEGAGVELMRDYGKVSPQFWVGKTGKSLRGNMAAQIVALYLMTSPHANMIGVFYCPLDYIAKETGLDLEGASKALARLIEADFCTFDGDSEYVFVHRFAANQIGEDLKPADKRVQGIINELAKVPESQCRQAFIAQYAGPYNLPGGKQKGKGHGRGIKGPSKPETGAEAGTGAEDSPEPDGSGLVTGFAIPLNDGSEWAVTTRNLGEWVQSFPAVDVEQELREMRAWAIANPAKRKTERGIAAFAVRWLSKAQDTPGRRAPSGDMRSALAGAI